MKAALLNFPGPMAPLKNLIPGRLRSDSEGFTPEEQSRWFNELQHDQPQAVAEQLAQRVRRLQHARPGPRARFKALEQLLSQAEPSIRQLERMLDGSKLPLSSSARQAAASADRLLKQLAEAYCDLSLNFGDSLERLLFRRAFEMAALRAVQLIHRRAMVAHRAYSSGSSRRWSQFVALLSAARRHRHAHHTPDRTSKDTVENMVKQSCLMALADPTALESTDLAHLRFYVERFGHLCKLADTAPDFGPGIFLLDDSTRGPRRLKREHKLLPSEKVLDCRPLLEALKQQIAALRRGESPARLGLPLAANDSAYVFMLARCVEQWSEPRIRRHNRSKSLPHADLVVGFDPVRNFLASEAARRRQAGQADELDVVAASTTEWEIVDQSPAGFGIRLIEGQINTIAVGELVALRPQEGSEVFLCVTRRARNVTGGEFELGLELISNHAAPATMNRTLANGQTRPVPVLLLPRVAQLNGASGLIAPIGDVSAGMSMVVPGKDAQVRLEAVSTAERLASCELVLLAKS